LTPQDIILMEAGGNSFEVCKRLGALGLKACVLKSCHHVGKHAKTYADNDKMAAARIAPLYLAGNAPCVWVPNEQSRERRELLHAYQKAVGDHTAATNSIKSYLNVDFLQKYLCGEFGFRKLKIAPMGYYKSQSLWAVLRCLMCSSGKLFVQVSPEIIMPIDEIMMEFEGDELTILQASL
jgi:hypothetical protein